MSIIPVYDLGTMPSFGGDSRRLVHVERSGPAFRREAVGEGPLMINPDAPIIDQLVQSLQSQAVRVTGEMLNALHRRCFLDVCRVWPRVLKIAGIHTHGVLAYPRERWAWDEMREAVELALCYAEQPESLHWQRADALLRGYALEAAMAGESRVLSEIGAENIAAHTSRVEAYRAFADGRV